jgi:hypothetical protein
MNLLFFFTWATNLALVVLALKQRQRIGWLEGRRRKQYRPRVLKGPGTPE